MPVRLLFWRSGEDWAVRKGPCKLIGTDEGEMILFNLDRDIAEKKNIAKERPDLVRELLAAYKNWDKDIAERK